MIGAMYEKSCLTKVFLIIVVFITGWSTVRADIQLNAGGICALGEEENSFGFELGAGFYLKHSTSALASAFSLNYLGIDTISEEGENFDIEAGYDVIDLDYKLYFPIITDSLEIYGEGLIGGANTSATASIDDLKLSADEWGFACGFGGGIQWNIVPNFGVSFGYTYLMIDEPTDHGVGLGEDGLNLFRLNACFRF